MEISPDILDRWFYSLSNFEKKFVFEKFILSLTSELDEPCEDCDEKD